MISDVLFEAKEDIQRYLNDPVFAPCYVETRSEIEALLIAMERVQKILDSPPPNPTQL